MRGRVADHGCRRRCRPFRRSLTTAKNTTQEATQSSQHHGYGEDESVGVVVVVVVGWIGMTSWLTRRFGKVSCFGL